MVQRRLLSTSCIILAISMANTANGHLYPFESETRSVRSLDGIWNFRLAAENDSYIGHREEWYKQELRKTGPVIPMPVPASYNDITVDKSIRDHVGIVWYDKDFFLPKVWNDKDIRKWLRFGGVHYAAHVYLNGEMVLHHSGGHVPFEAEVSAHLKYGEKNLISVAVNNTLTDITVPQGKVTVLDTDNGKRNIQSYSFDFFNYAGIHRPVLLYTTPKNVISDISIITDIHGDDGVIEYNITSLSTNESSIVVSVSLLDRDGNYVIRDVKGERQTLRVPQAKLWWPYLMDPEPGYMYTLEVSLSEGTNGTIEDIYRLPVGIRKLEWNNSTFTINGKPIYMRGFGRHEDSDIRGKGHDFPLIARDYNLLKWVGANAYRTSHYPYSEEIMDFADREGIMIIDECPGVNIGNYGFKSELLEAHKRALTELYNRDKNRPSVIMWSVANEARTSLKGAEEYFQAIAEHTKTLDVTRPITMAINVDCSTDLAGQFMDIIAFNKYNGWYQNSGWTDTITQNVIKEAQTWHKVHNKPVMITEYGADTMEGLHFVPDYIWSEEYQTDLFSRHFLAFDKLRSEGFFIGEMIWNFADFKTAQTYIRVGGNKKGIFTRNRQPKAAAHLTRQRYWALAEELDNAMPPSDVNHYVCSHQENMPSKPKEDVERYAFVPPTVEKIINPVL